MIRTALSALLLSAVASAATVTGINLSLGSATSSGVSTLTPAPFNLSGWQVEGTVDVNQTIGKLVTTPIILRFTNATITCTNVGFPCSNPTIGFSADITFDQNFQADVPYQVDIVGSGPFVNAGFTVGSVSRTLSLPSGNYGFSAGGTWTSSGSASTLNLSGFIRPATGNTGATYEFPNSFDIAVSPVFVIPEPATAGLAGAALACLAFGLRRRQKV